MKRVFLLLLLLTAATPRIACAAKPPDLDKPPPNLRPTSAKLSEILARYGSAAGRLVPGMPDTRQEVWAFTKAGLHGTETLARSGLDYCSTIVTGPLTEQYGKFLGHAWHRDANGVVSPVDSPDYTSFEMLLFMRNFDEALDPKNDVAVLGEVSEPKPAYVLQIKRPGEQHPDYAFYDEATGLMDRYESVVDDLRTVLTYDDYRTTAGLTQPWHVHFTDGTAALDDDFVRTDLIVGKPIPAKAFGVPRSTFAFASFNGRQSLPARVFYDQWFLILASGLHLVEAPTLVVRLNVAGRGLDFAVSAAQPESLIDFEVAQQLGLPSYGKVTHAAGDAVPYETIIPQADLGGLHLHDWAVRATPFHYHLNGETKVVGMLGYDVLSSGVFKIDYMHQTLELYPPQAFDSPEPPDTKGAYQLAVTFDDGMPFFSGVIADHPSSSILFDNDFDTSFLFGSFTSRYPDSVKDAATGKTHGTTVVPFADSKGYGKEVDVWLGTVPDLVLGPTRFVNFTIAASDGEIDLGNHEIDAVMGGDFLRFYDIYLDFPHARIFLRPNSLFYKYFKVESPK